MFVLILSMIVQNIALIEYVEIQFNEGLHVLSGETGAGKSILIDSINLLLGERADRSLIRAGSERASVEAVFDIRNIPQVQALLTEQELSFEDNILTIRREITINDRNLCRVCGVIVPLAFLRQISVYLVDIHGQHDHQSLLDKKQHMKFIDSFGDEEYISQLNSTAIAYGEWKNASTHFARLRKENIQSEQRQQYLTACLQELKEVNIQAGEYQSLCQYRDKMTKSEKINQILQRVHNEIEGDDSEKSIAVKLKTALISLEKISEIDEKFQTLADKITSIFYEVEEISFELSNIVEDEMFDSEKYDKTHERIEQIKRLERRYTMTAEELVLHREGMQVELQNLSTLDSQLKNAELKYKSMLHLYRENASILTNMRKTLCKHFELIIMKELSDLGMERTTFCCVFEEHDPKQKKIPTAVGDDVIHFYIATNPGEPLKPLDKTASGGELSRLMLAMKSAGAEKGGIPCMVFDEIDTGISGKIAAVVAEKMAKIGKYHQVLCVTHLAQIAAMADVQYVVRKIIINDRTYTKILRLQESERVEEVARLLGVINLEQESGMAHARSLLKHSAEIKRVTT